MQTKEVIVRTYSAGVHVGILAGRDGKEVLLNNARRIWRWSGAKTLHEISLSGVDRHTYTRISVEIPMIILTEAIEIIPVAEAADLSPVWNE